MAALCERAKFVGQERDRFPARVVQLIAGRPMQGLLGQRSQIARIKTAPPERFDNSDPIMMLVSRHKIDIGRDQRAQIISKRDIDRRTIIESANAHRQKVLRRSRRFSGESICEIDRQRAGRQNSRTAGRNSDQVRDALAIHRDVSVKKRRDQQRPTLVRF